ncbi:transcription factor Adf-1-like isoform X1 [Musca domestica]|uniref:Transcription factor Adf-1 isoform X1 n=1 Tax=Musca domestica TaxID=7370 RepID=A0A1I8MAN8_MUSDO|nr:transcription factor Adf-1 isoform X1 [Musca domestica]XP_058977400.1 transcription factor Adf-1-like isoform X1 [Musca domestica]
MNNNKESDLEFVKLVESYPILYAKEHTRGNKNSTLKSDVWREIAQRVKKSEIACITRWKSIRDRFGKEFRRQQQNPQDVTNWELFPHLWFLKDHYKQGSACNNDIECIKYEPKIKKRKIHRPEEDEDSGENSDTKISPEELALNQNIIALVKEHDVLYDRKRVRDSKNLTAKNEAWTNIANALGISEEMCYNKWKKLRDRFSREYRQVQLNPDKPITWIYFNDLRFLESHYRKGIPLPIEEIKRKERLSAASKAANQSATATAQAENPWGDDFSHSYYSDNEDHVEHELIAEETDIQELQEQTFDEFLLLPNKKESKPGTPNPTMQHVTYHVAQDVTPTSTTYVTTTNAAHTAENSPHLDAEDKLHNVISNMENVLRQSQDCLKAIQNQKAQFRFELEQQHLSMQPEMLQKVHILLDGLHPEQKAKAERKILQFLCECQIKILNNEEIADVAPVNIY